MPLRPGSIFIIIPLPRAKDPSGYYGAAQSFVADVDTAAEAAAVAHEHGFPRCAVVQAAHYYDPNVPDPPPLIPGGGP